MAIRIQNKNPLDINKRVAVGVSIPFNNDSVFTSTYTTIDQTKYNIINYLLTNNDERVLNPNFGANIRAFLFEDMTEPSLRALEMKLRNDISLYFSNVEITRLNFVPLYDSNTVQLNIDFNVYETPQNIQITF
jgi:phage baseplate assembly protein W